MLQPLLIHRLVYLQPAGHLRLRTKQTLAQNKHIQAHSLRGSKRRAELHHVESQVLHQRFF